MVRNIPGIMHIKYFTFRRQSQRILAPAYRLGIDKVVGSRCGLHLFAASLTAVVTVALVVAALFVEITI